jgi:hypothetical protein
MSSLQRRLYYNRQVIIQEGLIQALLSQRGALIELAVVGLLLAIATNWIAAVVPEKFKWQPRTTLLAGVILIVGVSLYFVLSLCRRLNYEGQVNAFFVWDRKLNSVIEVPRYEFGEQLSRSLEGAFAENPALSKIWRTDALDKGLQYDPLTSRVSSRRTAAGRLVSEASEYLVLQQLSIQLTDYFQRASRTGAKIPLRTVTRKDVSGAVLENRFLELFSRPILERELFSDHRPSGVLDAVTGAGGKNGAIFSRIELVLPDDGSIKRAPDGGLDVVTNRMRMHLNVKFDNFNAALPRRFLERYMGAADFDRYVPYEIAVHYSVSFPVGSLLTRQGWQAYEWIDSFIDALNRKMSRDAYFDAIAWEGALTTIELEEKRSSHLAPRELPDPLQSEVKPQGPPPNY